MAGRSRGGWYLHALQLAHRLLQSVRALSLGVQLAHQPIPLGISCVQHLRQHPVRAIQAGPSEHQQRAQVAALAGSAPGQQPVAQAIPRARHTYCPGALAASPAART